MRFVQQCRFLKVHVFSYSVRPGTAAADFPDQVAEEVKAQRSRALSEAVDAVRLQVLQEQLGTEEEVLLERPCGDGLYTGYTRRYVPVRVAAPGHAQGDIVRVRLGNLRDGRCDAEALD